MNNTKQSPRYAIVEKYYKNGLWTLDMTRNAVTYKWITEDEFNQITGDSDEPAEE